MKVPFLRARVHELVTRRELFVSQLWRIANEIVNMYSQNFEHVHIYLLLACSLVSRRLYCAHGRFICSESDSWRVSRSSPRELFSTSYSLVYTSLNATSAARTSYARFRKGLIGGCLGFRFRGSTIRYISSFRTMR